jgi:hypothetical protein
LSRWWLPTSCSCCLASRWDLVGAEAGAGPPGFGCHYRRDLEPPRDCRRPHAIELPREAEPSLTSPPPGKDGDGEHDVGVEAAQDALAPLQHKLEATASVSSPCTPSYLMWHRVLNPPHGNTEIGSRCRRPSVRSSNPGAETCSPTVDWSRSQQSRAWEVELEASSSSSSSSGGPARWWTACGGPFVRRVGALPIPFSSPSRPSLSLTRQGRTH